jgi:hypothetical protein
LSVVVAGALTLAAASAVGIGRLAVAAPTESAAAAADVQTSLVEDFSYPGAAQIEADLGIVLKRGDGNLVLADCGDITNALDAPDDLIVVETFRLDPDARFFCFKGRGTSGWLTMEIDSVFLARGDDAHTVTAIVEPIEDPEDREISVVEPGEVEPIGLGEVEEREGVLVELRYPHQS